MGSDRTMGTTGMSTLPQSLVQVTLGGVMVAGVGVAIGQG